MPATNPYTDIANLDDLREILENSALPSEEGEALFETALKTDCWLGSSDKNTLLGTLIDSFSFQIQAPHPSNATLITHNYSQLIVKLIESTPDSIVNQTLILRMSEIIDLTHAHPDLNAAVRKLHALYVGTCNKIVVQLNEKTTYTEIDLKLLAAMADQVAANPVYGKPFTQQLAPLFLDALSKAKPDGRSLRFKQLLSGIGKYIFPMKPEGPNHFHPELTLKKCYEMTESQISFCIGLYTAEGDPKNKMALERLLGFYIHGNITRYFREGEDRDATVKLPVKNFHVLGALAMAISHHTNDARNICSIIQRFCNDTAFAQFLKDQPKVGDRFEALFQTARSNHTDEDKSLVQELTQAYWGTHKTKFLAAERRSLETSIDKLTPEMSTMSTQIVTMTTKMRTLNSKMETLAAQMADLTSRRRALNSSNTAAGAAAASTSGATVFSDAVRGGAAAGAGVSAAESDAAADLV